MAHQEADFRTGITLFRRTRRRTLVMWRRMMAGDGPGDDRPVDFIAIHGRNEPGPKQVQDQEAGPFMPKSLRILADVAQAQDHPLKMVVGLAEIVNRRREPDAPHESVAITLGLQPEGQ